jgi:GTP-binding protein HflX
MISIVEQQKERAVLVGVELKRSWPLMDVDESLEELGRLAETAGVVVVGSVTQRVDRFDPATYMGSGKVEEVQLMVEELEADLVIFDDELSPRHQRELEKIFGEDVRLLDRTALILDIFAQHARTREGQLQVELAQLEYRLPRLTRMWSHLARQAGGRAGGSAGGVGLRGPGETQLESDRRMISQRISQLKAELERVRAHRSRHRGRRQRNEIPVVAIVGYTNAGKSTLLNRLSGANVLAADQLFATLDPTTRRVTLPGGYEVLFTDTVGFIQKLPTMLVAAFRATLEEIAEADTLVHIVDATHPQAAAQMESVQDTLAELQVDMLPTVVALNKVDRLSDPETVKELTSDEQISVPISALTGYGMEPLLEAVEETLIKTWVRIEVVIPYQEGALVSLFHEEGAIDQETHTAAGVHIIGRIPVRLAHQYESWRIPTPASESEEA